MWYVFNLPGIIFHVPLGWPPTFTEDCFVYLCPVEHLWIFITSSVPASLETLSLPNEKLTHKTHFSSLLKTFDFKLNIGLSCTSWPVLRQYKGSPLQDPKWTIHQFSWTVLDCMTTYRLSTCAVHPGPSCYSTSSGAWSQRWEWQDKTWWLLPVSFVWGTRLTLGVCLCI